MPLNTRNLIVESLTLNMNATCKLLEFELEEPLVERPEETRARALVLHSGCFLAFPLFDSQPKVKLNECSSQQFNIQVQQKSTVHPQPVSENPSSREEGLFRSIAKDAIAPISSFALTQPIAAYAAFTHGLTFPE